MSPATDVVVIGAGISGAAAAWELARAGVKVTLIDRYGPAAMASGWSLAGVRQSGRHPAELPLALAAVAQWQTLAERLGGETWYRQDGNLRLARTEAEMPVIATLVAEQSAAGLDLRLIHDVAEMREIVPGLSTLPMLASFCPSDGHAEPHASVAAFVRAAEREGAVLRFGERVLAIETAGGRVTGVRSSAGFIPAGRVILAAGIFGNELLDPLGLHVPLDVQMVSAVQSVPMPPMLAPVLGVANADVAGRQETNGRFRVTSGVEPWSGAMEDGPRPTVRPTADGLAGAIARFAALFPAFAAAPVEAIWAGLIDMTPDALPVLEASPEIEGLVIGMGFSGHGFCLGPVTGQILAALATGQAPGYPLDPFRLARFAGWNAPRQKVTLHG
jgi:sarcosine oxidase subunit beta